MGDFGRFLVKRSLNMVIVLLSTLILTMALVGPTMDKILLDATTASVVEETNNSDIKFQDTEERQNYIDQRIDLQIKAIGLDEPWYSPKRFTNTVLKVMILDLGRSNYLTSESGSANVRDIILEKMPKTILLFTTSTLIITVIGLYLGAFVANRAGSFWDKFNSAFAVFSSQLSRLVGRNAHDLCFCLYISYFSCSGDASYCTIRSWLCIGPALSYDFASYHNSAS